jgi:hypothetical protein
MTITPLDALAEAMRGQIRQRRGGAAGGDSVVRSGQRIRADPAGLASRPTEPGLGLGAMSRRPPGRSAGALFADRPADLPEHRQRLARRVQGLAAPALEATPPQQTVVKGRLVFLGDCRQTHQFPILLSQHVADQIVPRVTPGGRFSCSGCMITTIAPVCLSLRRD